MIARVHGTVLLARGDAAEAARIALAGATAADEAQAPLWAAHCRTVAGEALAARGRVGDARTQLHRATSELEARGAWGYRDAAVRVLRSQLGCT